MDAKLIQEIAKNRIKIILSSIAEAILAIMELYIIINYKGNFIAMGILVLLMIVALFFLISGLMDNSLKKSDAERRQYEEIYNAQKASYLMMKKSFEDLDYRLRIIEDNSSLPAEEIINAQKAVAKVTISRSKENTDALMNSNDELINQLFTIQSTISDSNNHLLDKQQLLMDATKLELQNKIDSLSMKLERMEERALTQQPIIQTIVQPEAVVSPQPIIQPVASPIEPAFEPVQESIPEPTEEVMPVVEEQVEEIEDLLADLGGEIDGEPIDEPLEDILEPIEEAVDEVAQSQEIDDLLNSLNSDLELASDELGEALTEDEPLPEIESEPESILDEIPLPEVEPITEEAQPEIEPEVESIIEEEIQPEVEPEPVIEEIPEPEPIIEPEPAPEQASEPEPVAIPDVGVDLSDPNRVMSPEEIEKLFASL